MSHATRTPLPPSAKLIVAVCLMVIAGFAWGAARWVMGAEEGGSLGGSATGSDG